MASAKMCDACGGFYKYNDDQNNENGIEIQHLNIEGIMAKSLGRYELCPNCIASIRNILSVGGFNADENEVIYADDNKNKVKNNGNDKKEN